MIEIPLLVLALFFAFCYLDLNKKYKKMMRQKLTILIENKEGNKRQITLSDYSCPNTACALYRIRGKENIRKRKIYGANKDRILFKCAACGKEFSETRGTMYFQKKKPISLIVKIIQYLSEGGEIRKASRLFDVSHVTVLHYLKEAGKKASLINKLHHGMKFTAFQFDELWSFIFKKNKNLTPNEEKSKGSFYGFVSYLFKHRFILDIHNGKRNDIETTRFIQKQKRFIDLCRYVLIMSDGFGCYMTALLRVFGRKSLFRYTKDNEPETVLPEKLLYGQVLKIKENNIVVDIKYRIMNGTKDAMNKILKKLGCRKITTSLIERVNLSIRHQIGRFKRKGMGFSKCVHNHEAALELFRAVYNYATPNRGIGGLSPAMSIGITSRVWTIEDILRFQPAT